MNSSLLPLLRRVVSYTALLVCSTVGAAETDRPSLSDLLAEGKLRVEARLAPSLDVAPTQQVELIIEIATDRWFAAGTRIGLFEVEGAIVLRRNSFATNLTRRKRGQTWTVQIWTLHLHAQRAGVIQVPPIDLDLTIAGDDAKPITGRVQTEPMTLQVAEPPVLELPDSWIATDQFTVLERFDRSISDLLPGDAFNRTVVLEARNLPALLLPTVNFAGHEGLAAYVEQPEFKDTNNRGIVVGKRTESATYVLEKEGRHVLPAQEFFWWDTQDSQLRRVTLPEYVLETSNYIPPAEEGHQGENRDTKHVGTVLVWITIAIVLMLLRRRFRRVVKKSRGILLDSRTQLERDFARHCRRGELEKAVTVLYKWLDRTGGQGHCATLRSRLVAANDEKQLHKFDELLASVYSVQNTKGTISPLALRRLPDYREKPDEHSANNFALN